MVLQIPLQSSETIYTMYLSLLAAKMLFQCQLHTQRLVKYATKIVHGRQKEPFDGKGLNSSSKYTNHR